MIDRLLDIVGPKGIVSDPSEMTPYLTDWRGRKQGRAVCVVLPASTDEVAAVMRVAAEEKQPVFPLGGNTGLCYGAVPESDDAEKPGIVLSLRRMHRIRDIDTVSDIITVDAGVILAEIHQAADKIDRQFPLRLGSEGSAQVGGLISTNAGGTAVVRYGPMRDLVAGLEVVLADGRIVNDLAALRKDNTGYMLRQLFIGAEGTLGIITGAALRLFPTLSKSAHAWIDVVSPADAVKLLARFRATAGSFIEAFELVSASQFELVRRHVDRVRMPFAQLPAWSLMVELSTSDSYTDLDAMLGGLLEEGFAAGLVGDAVVAASNQQAKEIWHVRHSVSEANKKEGIGIVHDIAVRTSFVPAFIDAADKVAAERFPEATTQVVCHLGDGNVHYILMFSHDYWNTIDDQDGFALDVERAIHDVGVQFGGTFSAEHGVGRKLPAELERLCDPLRYELMQQIKHVLDPDGRMNPGVLLKSQ
ncbi:FAD-binding oxidoreductase [Phyllobacterium zundukense]|uniref:FAD-binding oxidoreductase n=1 Tax=Phyllobacterium zundukense TaxID=1867719 RepID=A0ACD4D982_9HYPH|nr:FAD-binding oxidoreductase [Phyllobacterium zundukense]UXN62283.1 FAD-binding oxidoreductase [Phyllobacterium zundukense]